MMKSISIFTNLGKQQKKFKQTGNRGKKLNIPVYNHKKKYKKNLPKKLFIVFSQSNTL